MNGERYLARCVATFEKREDTGFVAIQGLSSELGLHAHGGVGLTHARVLEAVHRAWGSLPHRQRHETQGDLQHVIWGEVLFTYIIAHLGYALVNVETDVALYTFAHEHMMRARGIAVGTKRPGRLPKMLREAARLAYRLATRLD